MSQLLLCEWRVLCLKEEEALRGRNEQYRWGVHWINNQLWHGCAVKNCFEKHTFGYFKCLFLIGWLCLPRQDWTKLYRLCSEVFSHEKLSSLVTKWQPSRRLSKSISFCARLKAVWLIAALEPCISCNYCGFFWTDLELTDGITPVKSYRSLASSAYQEAC